MPLIPAADMISFTFVETVTETSTVTTTVPDETFDLGNSNTPGVPSESFTVPGYSYDTPETTTSTVLVPGHIFVNDISAVNSLIENGAVNPARTVITLNNGNQKTVVGNVNSVLNDITV